MSQYVVFFSCWLLAVGRGSGLSGTSSRVQETTTPLPHSPRPPASTTPLPTTYNHTVVSTSFTFYPSQANTTSVPPGLTTSIPTTPFTTTPLTRPTDVVTPPESSTSSRTSVPTHTPVTTTRRPPLFKERVPEVPQGSQKELFIRRKHKGPFHANRVRKLSETLRATDFPEGVNHRVNKPKEPNSTDFSILVKNTSLKNVTVKSAKKTFKILSRNRLSSTRRPHPTEIPEKRNTAKRVSVGRARKRPIVMGIPASSTVLLSHLTTTPATTPASTPEAYNPPDSDEYYASYGEYPDLPVMGYNTSGYSEAAVLPDPDAGPQVEEEAEVEAEVVLPDDSLADTDLHDHDLIDSVMYIYFGSSERDERGAGRQVLIVGAVISLVAQFLTLVSVLRRLRAKPDESASLILLNAELALTAANLVFMLGVQATGSKRRCELVAVALHYLHLVTCSWFLVNSVFSYSGLQQTECRRRLRPWWLSAWCGPALVVLTCVVFNRRGYETRSFCWVSVARGMLYSFMVPVAVLILLNTCLAVLGMRQLSLSAKSEDSDRKSMRVSATLLPVFAVVWFLGVVALENSASLVFPLLFVASSGFLNWFVLACWLPADMSLWRESDEDYDDEDDDLYEEVLKAHTDAQPLLDDPALYVCGRRDACELQMDPICTISS